jgi:hypothetical protein
MRVRGLMIGLACSGIILIVTQSGFTHGRWRTARHCCQPLMIGLVGCPHLVPTIIAPQVQAVTLGPCDGQVCPKYLYADHETYASWYAQKCPNEFVNLDTGNRDPAKKGDCNDPNCLNCEGAAHFDRKDKKPVDTENRGRGHVERELARGLDTLPTKLTLKDGAELAARYVARIEIQPNVYKKAKIYLIRLAPPGGGDPLYYGHGHEHPDQAAPANVTIANDDLTIYRKTARFMHGNNEYQVIFRKTTDLKGPGVVGEP